MPALGPWYIMGFLVSLCLACGFVGHRHKLGPRLGRVANPALSVSVVAVLVVRSLLGVPPVPGEGVAASLAAVGLGIALVPTLRGVTRAVPRIVGQCLLAALAVVVGVTIGLPFALVDAQTLTWCAGFWFAAFPVLQLKGRRGAAGGWGLGRFSSYRQILPLEDAEAVVSLRPLPLYPQTGSYAREVASLTVGLGVVLTGRWALSLGTGDAALLVWLLPFWASLWSRCTAKLGLQSSSLAFTAAALAVWVAFTSLQVDASSAVAGFQAFLFQAAVGLGAAYILKLPVEALAPAAMAVCGQPGLAVASPLLSGQHTLARCVANAMPVFVLLHWVLMYS